jgi:2-polyprenyl-3-methyl-5-hydroxy-6-metoxy-1,4-benzoquinol methylase
METPEQYAQRAQIYDGEIPSLARALVNSSPPNARVLDIGCGDGALLDGLASARPDLMLVGVDMAPERLAILRRSRPFIQANIDDAESLKTVDDDSIDIVLSSQVIEHVDDARMLAAIARVLKPGGSAYVSTVWKEPWAWYFRRAGGVWALDPTHLREYTENDQLLRHVRSAALDCDQSLKTPISYPIVDPLIKKFMRGQHMSEPWQTLRRLRIPICGYRLWELVLKKSLA